MVKSNTDECTRSANLSGQNFNLKPSGYVVTDEDRRELQERKEPIYAQILVLEGRQKSLLSAVRKLRAATGAGIYAKAKVVQTSQTGAARLAQSLAVDLLNAPAIRASIWPADMSGEVA